MEELQINVNDKDTGLSAVVDETLGTKPRVEDLGGAAEPAEKIAEKKTGYRIPRKWRDKRDKYGRELNPDYHQFDDNGDPIINTDGTIRCKSGRGSVIPKTARVDLSKAKTLSPADTGLADPATDPAVSFNFRNYSELSITFLGAFLGRDIRPETKTEWEELDEKWERYEQARGLPELPPEVELFTFFSRYVQFKAEDKPTVRERLELWKLRAFAVIGAAVKRAEPLLRAFG